MRFMPVTALTALVGQFAIAGVPLVQRVREQVEPLHRRDPGRRGGAAGCRVRDGRHPHQRDHARAVHQVLRRDVPVAHQRAGGRTRAGARPTLEVGWNMRAAADWRWRACVSLFGLAARPGALALIRTGARTPAGRAWARSWPTPAGRRWPVAGWRAHAAGGLRACWCWRRCWDCCSRWSAGCRKLGGAQRRAAAPWLCGYARGRRAIPLPRQRLLRVKLPTWAVDQIVAPE